MDEIVKETTPRLVWVISVDFADHEEASRAYEAIHELLGGMGQIGTLTMHSEPAYDFGGSPMTQCSIELALHQRDRLFGDYATVGGGQSAKREGD